RAVRGADRGDPAGRPVRRLHRAARAAGVAPRAPDGARDQSRARGVSRADAARGRSRMGRHGAHAGARGRRRLVPPHLPDRQTGRTPMAARATLTALGSALVLSALAAGGARAQTSVSVYGDGRFLLATPGTPLFPAELVRSEPQVTLALEASRSRPRTEIAYSAAGASWEAVYQIVLADGKASVSGAATVRSQAVRADSAEV